MRCYRDAPMKIIFVIEHLECEISKWLYYEYAHASEIVGENSLFFTNVKKENDVARLIKLGAVEKESAVEIFRSENAIILDPKAEDHLKPEDFANKDVVIVGGILGENPPKGRTRKLLTNRFPQAAARSIGKSQFSIDGAIYIAKQVSEGTPLKNITVKKGLSLRLDDRAEVYLPYAYPLKDGKPVVSQNLVEYLCSDEIVKDEEKLLR